MSGTVVLDSLSVDKVLSRFEYSLVKFDTFYPTGDKHAKFASMAQAVRIYQQQCCVSGSVSKVGLLPYPDRSLSNETDPDPTKTIEKRK